MDLHDFKKFQSIIDKYTNATVKKGGPLGNMTLKKKGGNWVKGNDKKGGHWGLEKSKKKGVIEFKIGQQSKKGGHRGNGSLKMGAYWQAHAAGSSWECPPWHQIYIFEVEIKRNIKLYVVSIYIVRNIVVICYVTNEKCNTQEYPTGSTTEPCGKPNCMRVGLASSFAIFT